MTDLIKISDQIRKKIQELESGRGLLKEAAHLKAQSSAEYDRELAKTIIRLKNGDVLNLDGMEVLNPPATVTEKIARGICWQLALEKDKQEALYKNAIKNLDCIQSELNGFQSINRFLADTP